LRSNWVRANALAKSADRQRSAQAEVLNEGVEVFVAAQQREPDLNALRRDHSVNPKFRITSRQFSH